MKVNKALFLLVSAFSISISGVAQSLTTGQTSAVRRIITDYCDKMTSFAYRHDGEVYDQLIHLFSHRDVRVYNDLAFDFDETSIYNYLTTIDRLRPVGKSIIFEYSPSPYSIEIETIETSRGTDAQVRLKKKIRGGKEDFYKTVENIVYISLDDYKITGIFDEVPNMEYSTERYVFVRNSCEKQIEFAIRYKNTLGDWDTGGWWSVKPNSATYLLRSGERVETNYSQAFYYAKIEGTHYDWSGDNTYYFKGDYLDMQEYSMKIDKDGDYGIKVSCDDYYDRVTSTQILFNNDCGRKIKLAMRYKENGSWKTNGWWNIDGNKETYLASNNIRLELEDPTVYFYAKVIDAGYVWKGDHEFDFSNETLKMRTYYLSKEESGDYKMIVHCNNWDETMKKDIYVKNDCKKDIKLALRHKKTDGTWATDGWWNIDGKQHTFLSLDGVRLSSETSEIYYYAESIKGRLVWSGSETYTFGYRDLSMKKMRMSEDSDGDYNIRFTCN